MQAAAKPGRPGAGRHRRAIFWGSRPASVYHAAAMTKLQVVYVVIGLLVAASMVIALLPPPR
jgi:hypothetical protein